MAERYETHRLLFPVDADTYCRWVQRLALRASGRSLRSLVAPPGILPAGRHAARKPRTNEVSLQAWREYSKIEMKWITAG
jgi:hypothetical protein